MRQKVKDIRHQKNQNVQAKILNENHTTTINFLSFLVPSISINTSNNSIKNLAEALPNFRSSFTERFGNNWGSSSMISSEGEMFNVYKYLLKWPFVPTGIHAKCRVDLLEATDLRWEQMRNLEHQSLTSIFFSHSYGLLRTALSSRL